MVYTIIYTIQYNTIQYISMVYTTIYIQYNTIQYIFMVFTTIYIHNTKQYNTSLWYILNIYIQYNTIQYISMVYTKYIYTIQYIYMVYTTIYIYIYNTKQYNTSLWYILLYIQYNTIHLYGIY